METIVIARARAAKPREACLHPTNQLYKLWSQLSSANRIKSFSSPRFSINALVWFPSNLTPGWKRSRFSLPHLYFLFAMAGSVAHPPSPSAEDLLSHPSTIITTSLCTFQPRLRCCNRLLNLSGTSSNFGSIWFKSSRRWCRSLILWGMCVLNLPGTSSNFGSIWLKSSRRWCRNLILWGMCVLVLIVALR